MSQERRLIIALFALALGLRVLYAALSTRLDLPAPHPTSDLNYAKAVAGGFGWIVVPFSPMAPGYPVVLGVLSLLTGGQMWLLTFMQAVLGALTVVALYFFGRELLGRTFGMIAAVWFAFHAQHMHSTILFRRDVLVVLLLVVLLFLLTKPFKRMGYGFLAGLVAAALVHVEPMFIMMLPLFAIFLFFKTGHTILNIQYFFVFVIGIILFTVPWTVRNSIVYGQPIPVSLEAERYFLPARVLGPEREKTVSHLEQRAVEGARSRRFERNAVEFWRFGRYRETTVTQGDETLTIPAWSFRHNFAGIMNFGILLPFALVGIYFAIRRRDKTVLMLAVTIVVYFLMHLYFGGSERARLPIDPFITLIAFYGVVEIGKRWQARRAPAEAVG